MKEIKLELKCENEKFEGWGTALCWWANVIGSWKDESCINKVCDLLFDVKKGLGLNVVRYNFGSGVNPPNRDLLRTGANIPSYYENGIFNLDNDAGQRKILEKSIERGVNIKEGFFNSPPIHMLKTNSTAGEKYGGNNLREECYEDFIEYTVKLLQGLEAYHGLRFETLSLFNEPSSVWWRADNNQEGCHYSVESQNILLERFAHQAKEKGLYDISISCPEGWSTNETIGMYLDYNEKAKSIVNQINTHTYGVDDRTRVWLNEIAKNDGKKLWMSEVCIASPEEHNHEEYKSGLMIAESLIKDIKLMKPQAWIYWQAVEDEMANHNYGFIHAPFNGDEEFFITKSYYYIAQFTKYIRPNCRFIEVENENVIASFDDKSLILVILNKNDRFEGYCFAIPAQFKEYRIVRTSPNENLNTLIEGEIEGDCIKVNAHPYAVTTIIISQ